VAVDDAAYCGSCGAALAVCPACHHANPAGNRYCARCGTPLPTAAASAAAGEGERRQLTVMFCDLVDSTVVAGRVDPEDYRALVDAYQRACADAIGRAGGYIAHYMGDGLLAYFGYPVAEEDAAARAVRAGLAVVAAVGALRPQHPDAAVRVGVHSGLVVVAPMGIGPGRIDADVVGETPNIAARLQSAARPGEVVVSGATRALVGRGFTFEPLGPLPLKGVGRPVDGHRVVGPAAKARTGDVEELAPMVGRDREMALLLDRLATSMDGAGQVVVITAEPGVGKSRLVSELRSEVARSRGIGVELRGSSHHRHTTLHPLIEHLRRALDADEPEVTEAALLARIEQLADLSGVPRALAVPVVADLVGVPSGEVYVARQGSPELLRRHSLQVVTQLLIGLTRQGPVVLVCEDAHWIDATTADLMACLLELPPVAGLLIVITQRPTTDAAWPELANLTRLELGPLPTDAVESIVNRLAGDTPLPADVRARITDRTEGIPLFAEELTRAVLEAGATAVVADVPATLRDSLMARLDRVGGAREVAQLASVVGREVPYDLLEAVAGMQETLLRDDIERLVDAGIVQRRGGYPRARVVFRHTLVQEVAYDSLLRSARRRCHQDVATALESRFPERATEEPDVLAHHLELGGRTADAVAAYRLAGQAATRRSANAEAIAHLQAALRLVRAEPPGPERDERELEVLMALGVPVTAAHGYGAAEVEEVYSRAGELCEAIGDRAPLFDALYGTFRIHLLRAEYAPAERLARRLAGLATQGDAPAARVAAARALGSVHLYQGAPSEVVLGDLAPLQPLAADHPPGTFLVELNDVVDPIVTGHAYAAWGHWLAGHADQARRLADSSVVIARTIGHPFTLTLALCFDAWLHQFLRDSAMVRVRAREAHVLAVEQGFPFWIGWAEALHGWGRAVEGETEVGVAEVRQGLVDWQATGSRLGTTYFLSLLADGLRLGGELAEATETLEEARRLAEDTGEGFWAPELARLLAEVRAADSAPPAEVLALLDEAETAASQRNATALVLRAALSRLRLAPDEATRLAAGAELSRLLAGWAEGFDTADVVEALAATRVDTG
jgi:class 3 adenylate cyclase/predicted ATPase